jgi:CheY-like chemotaxis protein
VEDDPIQRRVVERFLTGAGYEVVVAAEGGEALDLLERERPALILLDMLMPGMDGWTFARELQRREIQIPILITTTAEHAADWAQEIGATGAMIKPLSLPLLDAHIRVVLADWRPSHRPVQGSD